MKHTGTMLGRLLGDNVTLNNLLCHDLGTIKADPGQIEQVLMNLAVNARDAMPEGGKDHSQDRKRENRSRPIPASIRISNLGHT